MKRFHTVSKITTYLTMIVGLVLVAPGLASAATLSFSPTSGSYASGDTFDVKINLDTESQAPTSTDVIARFDPSVLQVVDSVTGTTGVQVLPGSLYSATTLNTVDNGTGTIKFSAANTGSSGYTGSGTLATITFRGLKEASTTAVTFTFTSGQTTDSNVSLSNSDLLTRVTDASFTITAASDDDDSDDSDSDTGDSTDDDSDSSDNDDSGDTDVTDTNGANGNSGDEGSGGSGTVAGTGIDLSGIIVLTIVSLIGAGYFLTRKPRLR